MIRRAQVQAFAAQMARQHDALYPAKIVFAGETKEWCVAFGAIRQSRVMPEHGQGFVYLRESVCHFPVDESFRPKLGDRFTRIADDDVPEASDWLIDAVDTLPNHPRLRLKLSRVAP